ncbi:MAG TPA: hypothetical protein PKH77_27160, partial [Anaerolineae bacterium]|nr:hypothetical protein [Anaerolineae bacterium]
IYDAVRQYHQPGGWACYNFVQGALTGVAAAALTGSAIITGLSLAYMGGFAAHSFGLWFGFTSLSLPGWLGGVGAWLGTPLSGLGLSTATAAAAWTTWLWTGKTPSLDLGTSPVSPNVAPDRRRASESFRDGLNTDKVPESWGPGNPTKKGIGWRWWDPNNPSGNRIEIDQGNPLVSNPTQQVDHVRINHNGSVIGCDGVPIVGSIQDNWEKAHIPYSEWVKWTTWFKPK